METSWIDSLELGKSGVRIPCMGLGAWAWGDRFFWGFGRSHSEEDVHQAFDAGIEAGLTFIDTAEIYGNGVSERLVGKFVKARQGEAANRQLIIATKFFPFPWRLWKGSLLSGLRRSLARLQMEQVDLYQIHQPYSLLPMDVRARELARAVKEGYTLAVGVSNYNANQTRRTYEILEGEGIPLASNQVEYSLLNRRIETNGVMDLCRKLGTTIISYSPLAMGVLTGKYTSKNPPPGLRGRYYNREYLDKIQPLLKLMREIGQNHGSKSISQVALNWAICKGTVPIPGAKTARQAQENAGALGWRLTPDEVEVLDRESKPVARR